MIHRSNYSYIVTRKIPFARKPGMLADICVIDSPYASPVWMCTSCRCTDPILTNRSSTFAQPSQSSVGRPGNGRSRASTVIFRTMCWGVIRANRDASHGS